MSAIGASPASSSSLRFWRLSSFSSSTKFVIVPYGYQPNSAGARRCLIASISCRYARAFSAISAISKGPSPSFLGSGEGCRLDGARASAGVALCRGGDAVGRLLDAGFEALELMEDALARDRAEQRLRLGKEAPAVAGVDLLAHFEQEAGV